MALTEKLQIRLSPEEKKTIFRLAASRSLRTGTKVSAADLLRSMVTKALGDEKRQAQAEQAADLTDQQLEAMR